MTQFEKDEALRVLREDQLKQSSIMSSSDPHASKCTKLGIDFQETYPNDYTKYTAARTKYNENEAEIARIEAIVPEEPEHPEQA